jgi:hypothetical protein
MEDRKNAFDDKTIDETSFSFADLLGVDQWKSFTPVFGSLTVIGATSYSGRYRFVGKSLQFQVQFSAVTSIASAAGTDYLTLPVTAKGLAGIATMMNKTTNIAVGVCVINTTTSRCYLPAQGASADVFLLCGQFEIG